MTGLHTFLTAGLTAMMLLVTAGCVDLGHIQRFSRTDLQSHQYRAMVNDYVASPLRQKKYQPAARHDRLQSNHLARQKQRPRLMAMQTVLVGYLNVLGQLAGSEVVQWKMEVKGVDRLGVETGLFDDRQVKAYNSLSQLLAKAATDQWRQRHVRRLIERAHEPVQRLSRALAQILRQGFAGSLEEERLGAGKHYDTVLRAARSRPPQEAGIAALQEIKAMRLQALASKQASVRAYADMVDKFAAANEKLYASRSDISGKQLIAQLKQYQKEIKDMSKTVQMFR